MSRTRWNLPAAEQREYLATARRLRNAGGCIPIIQDESPTPSRMTIEQTAECYALDLPHGGLGFVIWVEILVLVSNVIIRECQLLPYRGQPAEFLPDPTEQRPPRDYYFVGGELTYSRTDVLNHRLTGAPTFNKGDYLEGAVLAKASDTPDWFRNALYADLEFVIFDQFGDPASCQITAQVDHCMRGAQERLRRRARVPLFSELDRQAAESSAETKYSDTTANDISQTAGGKAVLGTPKSGTRLD